MPELTAWGNFCVIVGAAAGTLIGLQFVVITLVAENPPPDARAAGAAFASPTIFHFGVALFLSALLQAPWRSIFIPAIVWGILGFAGAAYTLIIARCMQKQNAYQPECEDWLFHIALPLIAYLALAVSAFTTSAFLYESLFGVGAVVLLLLFIGIHNAWDSIIYHVLVNKIKD